MPPRTYSQYCSLARALDLVGERWTLLLVRDLLGGPRRYGELLEGLPGIGTNLLAARLRELGRLGLVERVRLPEGRGRGYRLTAAGRELEDALAEANSTMLCLAADRVASVASPTAASGPSTAFANSTLSNTR